MAENKKSLTAKIITIIEEEMKFSDKFGIQYFEQSTFSKIENILSQMRRMMVIKSCNSRKRDNIIDYRTKS